MLLNLFLLEWIYIYICVCVCVCVNYERIGILIISNYNYIEL